MRLFIRAALCLMLLAPAAYAEPGSTQAKPEVTSVPVRAVEEASYKLQPGDELEINVVSLPQLEKKYVVRADGNFFHPVIGELKAVGETVESLRKLMAKRLAKELRNPAFRLGLATPTKVEVSVLGEVAHQGKFAISPGTTVFDVLALAGGLAGGADPESATLLRSGKTVEVNLSPPLNGDEGNAMTMKAGDILYVHAGSRISIAGEVYKPGVYAVSRKSHSPMSDVLKAAGGAKTTAALNRVKLVRPSLSAPLVVSAIPDEKGEVTKELQDLQDGDTIVIPERQAVVLGAVGKQGPIPLQGDEQLFDVVSASGLNEKAELSRVIVVRAADVKAGRANKEEYNLRDILTEQPESGKRPIVPIRDGDMVFVPTKEEGGIFQNGGLLQMLLMARTFFL